ncbi:TetR/AcrR family transcriptional regulator [Bacillus sp. NPDC077027]|uniref:TetR/AcrR family transcriptional regulator n=1 Tax=Bacillus sp. NPDC077027 TaxID=3390548 RepID=UPI003D032AC3
MTTKKKIVKTAALLFRKQGYHATGLNQIIKESGAPKGSLYHYFPNGKEELAISAVQFVSKKIIADIEKSLAFSDDPLKALQHFVSTFMTSFTNEEERCGIPIVLIAAESEVTHTKLHLACKIEMFRWQQMVKEKLMTSHYEEEEAEELASFIHSMILGSISMTIVLKNTKPLHDVKKHLHRLF